MVYIFKRQPVCKNVVTSAFSRDRYSCYRLGYSKIRNELRWRQARAPLRTRASRLWRRRRKRRRRRFHWGKQQSTYAWANHFVFILRSYIRSGSPARIVAEIDSGPFSRAKTG